MIKSSLGAFYTNENSYDISTDHYQELTKKNKFSKGTDERDVVWCGYLLLITEKQIQTYYQLNIVYVIDYNHVH